MMHIKCEFADECVDYGKRCLDCVNNALRNYKTSFYQHADDICIKNESPVVLPYMTATYISYECPVCGNYTEESRLYAGTCCRFCGYRLNIETQD